MEIINECYDRGQNNRAFKGVVLKCSRRQDKPTRHRNWCHARQASSEPQNFLCGNEAVPAKRTELRERGGPEAAQAGNVTVSHEDETFEKKGTL